MPKRHGFTCDAGELRELAQAVLERARRAGASGCDCDVSEGYGLSVTVRKGKPDTIEHNRDRSIGVTVYFGERPKARRGPASTSDFSGKAMRDTVDAALRATSLAIAVDTASRNVWSRTGLVRKSTAPAFIAWTLMAMSP